MLTLSLSVLCALVANVLHMDGCGIALCGPAAFGVTVNHTIGRARGGGLDGPCSSTDKLMLTL